MCPVRTCPVVICPTLSCPASVDQTMKGQTTEDQTMGDQITRDQTTGDQMPKDQSSQDLPKWVFVAIPVMAILIVCLIVALCVSAYLGHLLPCTCIQKGSNLSSQNRDVEHVPDQPCQDSIQIQNQLGLSDDDCRIGSSSDQALVVIWDRPRLIQPLDSDDDSDDVL